MGTGVVSSQPITQGLVVYLGFDLSLGGQLSTTNHGIPLGAIGTPIFAPGIVGSGSANFDNDGTGTTPSDWALSLGDVETIYAGSWSWALWFNSTNSNDGALFGNKDWTSGGNVGWAFDPSRTDFLNYRVDGGPRHDIGNASLMDGTWHHVAAVVDRSGNSVTTYVDGSPTASSNLSADGSGSLTQSIFTPNATLVGGSGNGLYSGSGKLDDVAIWNRALQPDEILAAFAAGHAGRTLASADSTVGVAPILTREPGKLTGSLGFPGTLEISAAGTPPLAFTWYHDGHLVASATNAILSFESLAVTDAGLYQVVVTNLYGSVTNGSPAQLTVTPRPTDITQDLAVYLNFEKTLQAQAGTTISGSVIGAVGLERYVPGIVGKYAASFQNDGDPAAPPSDWAVSLGNIEWIYPGSWTVSLWIQTQDQNPGIIGNKDWSSGDNVGWVIGTTTQNFLNYRSLNAPRHDEGNWDWRDGRWHHVAAVFYRDGNRVYTYVDGHQTDQAQFGITGLESLTPQDLQPNSTVIGSSGNGAWSAHALVDDAGIWTRSLDSDEILAIYSQGLRGLPLTSAVAAMSQSPVILSEPQAQSWPEGFNATYSVTAAGTPPLWYQWYKNGVNLPGQTNATLTLSSTLIDSGARLTVVVTNQFGAVTNRTPALLRVWPGPSSVSDNLIVHLNFESNLNPEPGTTYAGTPIGIAGIPRYTNGIVGKSAAWFRNDGSDSTPPTDWAVSLGDVEWIYTNNWTIAFWVQTTDHTPAVMGNKDWSSGENTGWAFDTTYLKALNYRAAGSDRHDVGNLDWRDGRWHHLAATFLREQNTVLSYVDGQPNGKAPLSATGWESLTPSDFTKHATLIGSSGPGRWSSTALIDDLGIWTRPVAPGEISAIFQAGQRGIDLAHAIPPRPKIRVSIVGSSLLLVFTNVTTPYNIESAVDEQNGPWTKLPGSPFSSGVKSISLQLTESARFYRLSF
jgi:Concanavalin A-like lectin/glucanases superfamily